MAVVVTALGFVLWYSSVERLGVERAGLFAAWFLSALCSARRRSASPRSRFSVSWVLWLWNPASPSVSEAALSRWLTRPRPRLPAQAERLRRCETDELGRVAPSCPQYLSPAIPSIGSRKYACLNHLFKPVPVPERRAERPILSLRRRCSAILKRQHDPLICRDFLRGISPLADSNRRPSRYHGGSNAVNDVHTRSFESTFVLQAGQAACAVHVRA
jgi:hypothetical protein